MGCTVFDERQGGKPGVWVIYGYDDGPYAISIHQYPVDVIENIGISGCNVAFWPLGMSFRDAVAAWENRNNKKEPDGDRES